jgi:hypothetical protein
MAHGKILRLQSQPGPKARRQGTKPNENGRFHETARQPAEAANRNDFNAVGIIGTHSPDSQSTTELASQRV